MQKIKLQKTVGNLLDKLRKLYMNGNGHLEIFSHSQVIENSSQYLLLLTDEFLWFCKFRCCALSCTYLTLPYICFYSKKLYFMALDSNFLNMINESDSVLQVR